MIDCCFNLLSFEISFLLRSVGYFLWIISEHRRERQTSNLSLTSPLTAVNALVPIMYAVDLLAQCDAVQLVTREEWGARPPVQTSPLRVPVNMSFVHHSEGSHCYTFDECIRVVRAIQDYHMDSNGTQ